FWKALREVFPDTREQWCWFHVSSNVFAALPKSAHPGAKAALAQIHNAEDRDHALNAVKAFEADYGAKWPKAVAKITEHTEVLLAFYDYPAQHWIHLRTTNPIESTFATVGCGSGSPRDRLTNRRNRHGLQADRGRPVTLARRQRTTSGRTRPRRREVRKWQTHRTPRRNHHEGGRRIKD